MAELGINMSFSYDGECVAPYKNDGCTNKIRTGYQRSKKKEIEQKREREKHLP